jgi:DNA-binding response OmpR family regulator
LHPIFGVSRSAIKAFINDIGPLQERKQPGTQIALSFGMTKKEQQQQTRQALLLEQNPGLARVLELMLRQSSYRVNLFTAEAEMLASLAPARLRTEGIDLVLADLAGYGPAEKRLLAQLRIATHLLPVIVIAPYGQEIQRVRSGDRPGCHFLTSPLEPEELRRCLSQITTMDRTKPKAYSAM